MESNLIEEAFGAHHRNVIRAQISGDASDWIALRFLFFIQTQEPGKGVPVFGDFAGHWHYYGVPMVYPQLYNNS